MAEYAVGVAHFYDMPNRRTTVRTTVCLPARLLFGANRGPYDCVVRDVTNSGAGLEVHDLKVIPMHFEMSFDNFRTARKCRLIWRSGSFIGVAFED
jgi:hypothetical protein